MATSPSSPADSPDAPHPRAPRHHRVVLDSIDQGFCVAEVLFDPAGRPCDYRFVETNAAFAHQTGLTDALGRRMRELVPGHEEYWFDIYGQVALTGRPVRFVQEARALDERWYDVYAFRVDAPELHRVAMLFTDITERVRSERGARLLGDIGEALITLSREEDLPGIIRAKAAAYFRISQCAFLELDVRQHFAVVNQSWDIPAAPPVGGAHRLEDFVTEDLWQAALAGQTVVVNDTGCDDRVAGAERFRGFNIGSFLAIPLGRDDECRHVFMLSRREPSVWREDQIEVARELASRCWTRVERLRTEIALKVSEERLRLILENAREYAILSMDLDRRVTSWSEGAERLLGYAAPEILGQFADLVFVPEDRETGAPEREASLALGEGRASNERWHLRKDGTRFWGSGAMMAMRNARGEIAGLLKILRDQTAVRLAQQALEQSQARQQAALELAERARADAEGAAHAKDRFLAALSHELRTPLNPVLMVAGERAADASLPAAVRADFEMVRMNIEHEARLIEDMLDINLIARGKLSLHEASVDLHCVLREAAAIVGQSAREKGIALSVEAGSPRATVRGDSARLKQIFLNLLNNAIKFTPENGMVAVVTKTQAGNEILVEITDTGLGLTEDELARAFEPFAQGQHAGAGGSMAFGGLGLGLAIVQDLVARHRGRVTARSDGRGRGAAFSVFLPLAGAEPAPAAPNPPAPAERHAGELKILLAEDHATTRTALQRILTQRRHAVVAVGSKREALAAAAQQRFDLAISDIGLPDGDGYQLFSELHAMQPAIRGIALSGFGMESDRQRSAAAGYAVHLVKPISMPKLEAAIEQLSGTA